MATIETEIPLWESKWNEEALRAVVPAKMTRMQFDRGFRQIPFDEEGSQFKVEWFQRAKNRELRLGERWPHRDWPTYTGLDLGVQQHKGSDNTVFATIVKCPHDLTKRENPQKEKRLLDLRVGKWRSSEIIAMARQIHEFYDSLFLVENNAAQDYLKQGLEDAKIPVRPYTTGTQTKAHPEMGIMRLGPQFEFGRWQLPTIPCLDEEEPLFPPEVANLVQEALTWSKDDHTGDSLMALFLADEASFQFSRPNKGGGQRRGGPDMALIR